MLTLTIDSIEFYNEETETFEDRGGGTIHLEHSLLAMSKWESEWKRAFLHYPPKTMDEVIHYIRCMSLDGDISDDLILGLTSEHIERVFEYMSDSRTASTINSHSGKEKESPELTTTELIYYWLVALDIPFSCETWNINRLLMLIRINNIKNEQANPNAPKRPQDEVVRDYRAENERRRAMFGTKG